jgi:CBS domain-containing protein
MAKVKDVMTPDPVQLPSSATTAEAAKQMAERNIGAILVHDGSKLCGVVTDRDITVRTVAKGLDPKSVKLSDICSGSPVTVSPDEDVEKVIALMREKAIRRVPVVDRGQHPVGILSLGDLASDRDPRSVLGQISSAPPTH